MIGETIGNFKVISRLGVGGMGEVWLAEQQSIGTRVAIKLLSAAVSQDTDHVQRFFNEARAVSRIQHAGIVKIFDVGRHAGQAYLIMEFLEGETLAQRLRRTGRLPLSQIGDVGKQIANVLDATHSAGITHRDLKPDNIFLVPDRELGERVKILDFGIAKLGGTLAGVSPRTHGTMGTPAYMAPEQWGDASKVDWRADLYSLGCVVFEMTTGRPPFIAQNIAEACGKHLHEKPPRISSLVPTVPAQLEQLIEQLLAKDPAARPASMRDVARTFENVDKQALGAAATLPVGAISLPAPSEPPPPRRSFPIVPIVLGLFALAAGAAVTIYVLQRSSTASAIAPHDAEVAAETPVERSPPEHPHHAQAPVHVPDAPPAPAPDAAVIVDAATPKAVDAAVPDAAAKPDAGAKPGKDAAVDAPSKKPPRGSAAPPPASDADSEAVQAAVKTRATQTKHCYEVALKEDATLAGSVVLQVKIDANGHVIDANADGLNEKVQQCLLAQVREIKFPKPASAPLTVIVPFHFEPD